MENTSCVVEASRWSRFKSFVGAKGTAVKDQVVSTVTIAPVVAKESVIIAENVAMLGFTGVARDRMAKVMCVGGFAATVTGVAIASKGVAVAGLAAMGTGFFKGLKEGFIMAQQDNDRLNKIFDDAAQKLADQAIKDKEQSSAPIGDGEFAV